MLLTMWCGTGATIIEHPNLNNFRLIEHPNLDKAKHRQASMQAQRADILLKCILHTSQPQSAAPTLPQWLP
jgi:hypothetical protein